MSIEQESPSKLIYVRSKDREDFENSTSSNFVVDLGSGSEIHKVKRLILRSATFQNSQYNC